MLVNAVYQQRLSLPAQAGQVEPSRSKVYQSFVTHETFYKGGCLSWICSKEGPKKKLCSSDPRFTGGIGGSGLNPKNEGQRFNAFQDIINYGSQRQQKYRCPYCNYWWPIGQKCQNPKCPTNQW